MSSSLYTTSPVEPKQGGLSDSREKTAKVRVPANLPPRDCDATLLPLSREKSPTSLGARQNYAAEGILFSIGRGAAVADTAKIGEDIDH